MAEQKATNITWHEGSVSRKEREELLNQKGVTVWMTGLSASGKSTIACILEQMLLHKRKHAYRLDGDNIRMGLNKNLGFTAEDRAENIRRIGEVAKLFTDAGVIAVTSFISPYRKDRDAVRASLKPGEFIECYVNVSLAEAEKRDPKGLYKKARAGQIKGFTGIDDPYEAPERPEIIIETEKAKPDEAAAQILAYLESGGYLAAQERRMPLQQFSHIMLYAHDTSRAVKWYRDVLGFSVTADYSPHYAMLWHEGMKLRLDLHPDKTGGNVGHGAQAYFKGSSLDAALAELRGKGVTVTEPKSESGGAIRFADFIDSEGNRLGLWEDVKQ